MVLSSSANSSPENDLEKQLEDAIAEAQMNGSCESLQRLAAAEHLYVERSNQAPSKVKNIVFLCERLLVSFRDPASPDGYGYKYITPDKLAQKLSVQ